MDQSPTLESLADLYAGLGLRPTQAELAAALVAVCSVLTASVSLEDIVPKEAEPLPSMLPPAIDQPGASS